MAFTKLSCPECGKVLRPGKPVAAGRKVKCPECETVFVAGEDAEEEDERRPARTEKAPAKGGKKAAPAGKGKEPKKQEEETYGYIKDPDEDDEDKKPKIRYAPDMSVKDPRGPAIVKLTKPASLLQLAGMIGCFGWLFLFVLLLIPTAFPLKDDPAEVEKKKKEAIAKGRKPEEEKKSSGPGFFTVMDFDLHDSFLMLMVPMMLMFCYSALVVGGGIKMQNLESRTFGIISSVMAMLPLNTMGMTLTILMVMQWLGKTALEDPDFGMLAGFVLSGLLYVPTLGVAVWSLRTLLDEGVKEGFEYVAE